VDGIVLRVASAPPPAVTPSHAREKLVRVPHAPKGRCESQILKARTGFASPMEQDVTLCKVEEIPMCPDALRDHGVRRHGRATRGPLFLRRRGLHYKWAKLTEDTWIGRGIAVVCKDCNGVWDLQTGQPKDPPRNSAECVPNRSGRRRFDL